MKKIFSFLWKYLLQEKNAFIMVLIPMFGAFILSPLVPLFYKKFIDLIAGQEISPDIITRLWDTAYFFFATIIVVQIFWKTLEYWLIPLESGVAKRIYHDSFNHILTQSHRFFSGQPSGSVVRIISRLADTTWQFIDTLIFQVLRFGFNALVMLVVLGFQHIYLGVAMAVWMIALTLIKGRLWRRNFELNKSVSASSTRISGQISDVFTNAFTVLTCGTQLRELKSFHGVVRDWTVLQRRMWWQEYRIFFTTTIFILILQIASLSGLIFLWSQGTITAGTCTLVIVYMGLFIEQAVDINFVFRSVYRQGSDMVEAIDLLSSPGDIRDLLNAPHLLVKDGEIRFENVGFSYYADDEAVLKNFSLHIRSGEKVALVGASGSGKSTLLKLLFRLYDIDSGSITIDGHNIAHVTQDSLRQSMSIVPQDPVLFHRSIAENIGYSVEQSTRWGKQVQASAQLARADEFIEKMPQKYNTLVGERGIKLSGGERQRIALARSIMADKPILALDEATSALDSVSEKFIQESLHEVMKGRTSIVIAHRLSTIMQMDRIIVMGDGKILEEGTHSSLLKKKNGAYKKLWDIQTGEFIRDV
ncbi:ABC transporter ATP-binding protein [Candidatus Gracilibacteria bacterium]|nr:ABC transporter ATP-binding protein [Candidatus Gracilibacteria bacterium]